MKVPRACLYCASVFYGAGPQTCGKCHGDDPTAWALDNARSWFAAQPDSATAMREFEQRVTVALTDPPPAPTPGAGIEFR